MIHYDFTLKYAIPDDFDVSMVENRLFEAGCDDALPGVGRRGRLGLAFSREANTAKDALSSAIADVQRAVPEARLIEVGPDLVGVTDLADVFSFSRQNMRKLLQTHLSSFPLPIHEGRSPIWHLAEVLEWFESQRLHAVDPALRDVARSAMRLNMAHEMRRLPPGEVEPHDALV